MSNEEEREAILQSFTCAHIRLTRASGSASGSVTLYRWAPGCVHPKMHTVFDGNQAFCDRCPCYTGRPRRG